MKIHQITPLSHSEKLLRQTKGEILVSLKQIEVEFNGNKALKNINLTIYANEIMTIVGPNGGGKSTLLKVLLKLLIPTKGKVEHKKGLKIGYVPQKLHLDHSMPITVKKFLSLKPNCKPSAIDEALKLYYGSDNAEES